MASYPWWIKCLWQVGDRPCPPCSEWIEALLGNSEGPEDRCQGWQRKTVVTFEEENTDLGDGEYTQQGTTADFDDILIYVSSNELSSSIAWRREIEEEAAVLYQAAEILAENDDDRVFGQCRTFVES